MRWTRWVWLAVLLVIATSASRGADAYKLAKSRHGADLFWPNRHIAVELRSLPAPFAETMGLDAGRAALERAIATWNAAASPSCDFRLVLLDLLDEDRPDVVVEATPQAAWKRNPTIAAYTEVVSNDGTGRVLSVRIELHAGFVFDDQDPVAPDRIDLESLLVHELGHALGLGHSYDRRALMRAGSQPGVRFRQLTDDDKKGVCRVFAPRAEASAP